MRGSLLAFGKRVCALEQYLQFSFCATISAMSVPAVGPAWPALALNLHVCIVSFTSGFFVGFFQS